MEFEEVCDDDLAYAKVGILGGQGSGKTRTAAEMAIGLLNDLCERKEGIVREIYMLDTEDGRVWVKKMCTPHKIKLLGAPTRSYIDLIEQTRKVADVNGILLIDSITHFWADIQKAFKEAKKRSELRVWDWAPIKERWQIFNDLIVTAPLHMMISGRLAFDYEEGTDDQGRKATVKAGVKMKSETDTGYEPHLLIVMDREQELDSSGKVIRTYRTAHVLKDRNPGPDCLDGKTFENPTYADFLPYFHSLNLGGAHKTVNLESKTASLFPSDKQQGGGKYDATRCTVLCEEITGLLKKHYPSRSSDDQAYRMDMWELGFGTRSWTAIESLPELDLKIGLNKIHLKLEGKPKFPELAEGNGLLAEAAETF